MMYDLYLQKNKDGITWRLVAYFSQRSCGENRSEYETVHPCLNHIDAQRLVDKCIARWSYGAEPKKVCGYCGQEIKK